MRPLEADPTDSLTHFYSLPEFPVDPLAPGSAIPYQTYDNRRSLNFLRQHFLDVRCTLAIDRLL